MIVMRRFKIRSYEMGLYFRDREFQGLLGTGTHWMFDPLHKVRVEIVSQRDPWLVHDKLDVIVKSAALKDRAVVLDLKDHERALVWIDGRFSHVLPSGLYAYWTGFKDVKVEVIDARNVRFEHDDFKVIVRSRMAQQCTDSLFLPAGYQRLKRPWASGSVHGSSDEIFSVSAGIFLKSSHLLSSALIWPTPRESSTTAYSSPTLVRHFGTPMLFG